MLNTIFSLLMLSADFEAGYVPQWSSMVYKTPLEYSYNSTEHTIFVTTRPKIEFKGAFLNFGYTTFGSPSKNSHTSMPFRGVWDFEAGYKINAFTFKYGHNCGHTIVTNSKSIHESARLTDVAYDKFSVCISFKNR